ncbi:hypothetical protein [Capnocytophaga canimorsus]|nr:hypothetical protein [Capnocytophaga canimorsus]
MKTLFLLLNLLVFSFVQAQQDSLQINQLEALKNENVESFQ